MKNIRLAAYLLILTGSIYLTGCGQAAEDKAHDQEESLSGATFKPGRCHAFQ